MSVSLVCVLADPAAIGLVSARGTIRIDGANVNGNASLFDGSVVETSKAMANLNVERGVALKLDVDSKGQLFKNRMVLERGASEFTNLGGFSVEANHLKIAASDSSARGVVRWLNTKTVEIAALSGSFKVSSDRGLLLANIAPGTSLDFEQQGGAAGPTTVSGLVTKRDGGYFIKLDTGVVYELTYANQNGDTKSGCKNLDSLVDKRGSIEGALDPTATPKTGASAVLLVSCGKDNTATKNAVKSAAKTGGAVAGGTAVGMAVGTKLIIAGVAIAGGAGAAAALAGGKGSSNSSASPQ